MHRQEKTYDKKQRQQMFLYGAILIFVLFPILQNLEYVGLRLFFWSFYLPKAIMILAAVSLGFLLGVLYCGHRKSGKK
jgi:uncharacterized integral membrane protein